MRSAADASASWPAQGRVRSRPRISTIVYQADLNLPYLGVKRALGELSDDGLRVLHSRIRPGRTALRYFDQLEWDA